MAEGAVLEARAPQIVERRRDRAERPVGRRRRAPAGWRGIPGRRTAPARASACAGWPSRAAGGRRAAFQLHRGVLEDEGAALIAVAIDAARLVGLDGLDLARQEAAVRIVAIDAGHGAFRQPVLVGPLEARPDIACGTWRTAVLMSAGLRATRPCGPFLWMAWQLVQLTWFLA